MRATVKSSKAQQSQRTREALLSTCLRLFAQRGVARTSIDDIARQAGVTKGAIYWHFASKEDLFRAILDRIRERWQEVVHRPVSERRKPLDRIEQLFDSYVVLFRETPEICLFLQQVLLDQHNKAFSNQVATVFAKTARFIAGIIEEGKAARAIRRDVDAMAAAHVMLGLLAGASQQAPAARGPTRDRLLSEAKAMALAYLTR